MRSMRTAPTTVAALLGSVALRAVPLLTALSMFACQAVAIGFPPAPSSGAKLVITPDEPFSTSGRALGVCDPSTKTYTLTNVGSSAATWRAEPSDSHSGPYCQDWGVLEPGDSVQVSIGFWHELYWAQGEWDYQVRFTAPEAEEPFPVVKVHASIGPPRVYLENYEAPCYTAVGESLIPSPKYLVGGGEEYGLTGAFTVSLALEPENGPLEGVTSRTEAVAWSREYDFPGLRVTKPGWHTLIASATGPSGTFTPVSTPLAVGLVGRQYLGRALAAPIVPDGVLAEGEWSGGVMNFGSADQDVLPGKWEGAADYRSEAMIRWDARNLYFAVKVTDDVVSFPSTTDADLYNRDGIELFLGLDEAAACRRTSYGAADFQVIVSADQDAEGNLKARWYSPQAPATVSGNPDSVAVRLAPGGYVIECALPWALLKPGFLPSTGDVIGLNVMAKDNDQPRPGEDSAFCLTGLPDASANPFGWTTARLNDLGYLEFNQSPGLSGVALPLRPPPVVTAEMWYQQEKPYEGPVTLSIASGPAGATLSGETVVNAVQGRAVFPSVSVDRRGYYVLKATCDWMDYGTSLPFDVWEAYTVADLGLVLGLAAGLDSCPCDSERLDVCRSGGSAGRIDLLDAIGIGRKLAGLETNP